MVTKKSNATDDQRPAELLMSRDEARSRLEERIQKGREVRERQAQSQLELEEIANDYKKWDAFNGELLTRMFTTLQFAKEYSYWGIAVASMDTPSLGVQIADLRKKIDEKIHRIDSVIERLELVPLAASIASINKESPKAALRTTKSNKVFIVHGHDEIAKTNLEVFLRELGLEPIVLHRQADEGLTVIEKFEKHSDVGYAFILLTPDEISYLRTEESKPEKERHQEHRARPNVIFEFGYFVGKLGRSRVCCLHTGNVTLPSDVTGMIYKQFSSSVEEVAYGIIKDLKAAGFSISMA